MDNKIPLQALQRLPLYLALLKEKNKDEVINISTGAIALELELGEIQVRKDLAFVSKAGKPKVGYNVNDLISDINIALGYDNVNNAILVGAGRLGKALLAYKGFAQYGLNIVAAFDIDNTITKASESGKPILPISQLKELCEKNKVKIGIITVPAEAAQEVCDVMVASGLSAIWNFAPTNLKAPNNVMIKSENMAASLAMLSKHLNERKI